MNRSGFTARPPAAAVLAAAAASGLVLAGCVNSSSATTASTSSSASGQPTASGSASVGTTSNGSNSNGGGTATAGTALFPLAVGNTWVYEEKLSGDSGMVSNKVTSVTPAADGNKVAMKVKDDLLGVHTGTTSIFIIHNDG